MVAVSASGGLHFVAQAQAGRSVLPTSQTLRFKRKLVGLSSLLPELHLFCLHPTAPQAQARKLPA